MVMESMQKLVSKACKLSHKQFRVILKKFRRKKIRQQKAKEREKLEILEQQRRESSPSYKEREEDIRRNTELFDQFEEKERIRLHKLWLLREEQAQEEFRKKQKQLEIEKIKREEERMHILKEFEKQEFVDKLAEEETKKIKSKKEEALQQALSNLSQGDAPWHNPIAPENYVVGKEREQCMFFSKTGCCRFGERCSRGHTGPTVSSTLLIRGMYSHFSIDQTARDDYDTDIALEYEDKECYQDFVNFYKDVLPEFKKFGKVIQFKVCNNFEPHLRGNVYVQYTRKDDAMEAYKNFNGRYYAGKQMTCEFTHVIKWKSAICGLHGRQLCPKGINCNFLHVFNNPDDEFWEANRDLPPRESHHAYDSSRRNHEKDARYRYMHNSRKSRHDYRDERRESRNERFEPRNDRYEYRTEKYDSRGERYESRNYYKESKYSRHGGSSDSFDEDYSSRIRKLLKKDIDGSNPNHRKRERSSSSRSRSRSPYEELNHRSHKKKKRKKTLRKREKKYFSNIHVQELYY